MFDTVLIANRGAIATRIIRTLKKLSIRSIAVYHEADADSLHVQHADEALSLGDGSVRDTYLNIEKLIAIAKMTGAKAIHPGYGFLSENTEFVDACARDGIVFIGPTAEQITLFGLKHQARDAAQAANVPLLPGSPILASLAEAKTWAKTVSYPVMLKSTAGGGGIGMQVCQSEDELGSAWESVKRLSSNYFSNDGVFLEKYIAHARHIEVQIFGDGQGTAIALGERDCSAQRRNQKVIEETPAPKLDDTLRKKLCQTAESLMSSVQYKNAGTVEYIYDNDTRQFYFLEVNTRLQVEHGVTEEVWKVDLVEWMLRQADGEALQLNEKKKTLKPIGHAIQVRIYAEDPMSDFRPCAGSLSNVAFSKKEDLRIDTWVENGSEVSPLFDPMIAKIICRAESREACLKELVSGLEKTTLYGIETNLSYLIHILNSDACKSASLLTNSLSQIQFADFSRPTLSVLDAGTMTTIQDFPARTGLWHVGVPPSGPMDNLSFRLANALVVNRGQHAGLEITLNGPTLVFNCEKTIAITGATIGALINDKPIHMYGAHTIRKGDTLKLGAISEGARAYLAISGGIDCPVYLGSRSTFTLGQFGGHNGRALRGGDVLHLFTDDKDKTILPTKAKKIPAHQQPGISNHWQIRVMYGPHGAPDFLTQTDIDTFFQSEWEVHYNSSRTGTRLIGPKPEWARETGGEAGLHPSNIHDNAYAFGAVDFTGDMPVILGPDGPSLGGFVCPATVINADLWKLGQLKAGAKIRFVRVDNHEAVDIDKAQNTALEENAVLPEILKDSDALNSQALSAYSSIISTSLFKNEKLVFRAAGDQFLLVELGPLELDIERRFKIHALMLWLEENTLKGVHELTPGIRSLQIHFDAQRLDRDKLIQHILQGTQILEKQRSLSVTSRTVYLPLSWDDEACKLAIDKYMQSVRPDAPWCPSNLEFIRRINGLSSIQDVKDIVFAASYLVMGLGDVYLGAPVATPVDPRHRLVTTKYNPARTWTAENCVGIGGAYMCVYGMEGPGGYQFVGRTLQMWNRHRETNDFTQPWLLRFFDQIRFYEVTNEELNDIRSDFPKGLFHIKTEETEFNLHAYQQFLQTHQQEITQFQKQRSQAFDEELEQWRKHGQLSFEQAEHEASEVLDETLPKGVQEMRSSVAGSIWQVLVKQGDSYNKGDTLMILESMKMEIDICAEQDGVVNRVLKQQGNAVHAGQALLWLTHPTLGAKS